MFREAENSALFPIYLTISIDQNRVGKWLIEFRGDYDNFFGFRNFLFINLSSNNSVIKKKIGRYNSLATSSLPCILSGWQFISVYTGRHAKRCNRLYLFLMGM